MIKGISVNAYAVFICTLISCNPKTNTPAANSLEKKQEPTINAVETTSLVVLGTVQDAGSPQIGCTKECCSGLFQNPDHNRQVSSLGLIDASLGKTYLFDATPDMVSQTHLLSQLEGGAKQTPDGIFLTHAHIGHYTGLMYLGKEALDAQEVNVFAMPRMETFLKENGPWSLLATRKNILLKELVHEQPVVLSDNITVTPFLVPHRDEFSETVGYTIQGPRKSALFIPDIDKWSVWDKDILEEIKKVDYAFVDATFYDGEEINNRDISQIPHPFVIESMQRFSQLSKTDKAKVHFIHFNHTNPIMTPESKAAQTVISKGYRIARRGTTFTL